MAKRGFGGVTVATTAFAIAFLWLLLGSFSSAQSAQGFGQAAPFDYDKDGHLDAAVVMWQPSGAILMRNDGTGDLDSTRFFPWNGTDRVATGDFNGDGWEDVALGSQEGFAVFASNAGAFSQTPWRTLDIRVRCLGVLDLGKDGRDELAVSSQGGLSFYSFAGAAPEVEVSLPQLSNSDFVISDLNGDGNPDVVAASNKLDIFLATSSSAFAQSANSSFIIQPSEFYSMDAGDLDGDGIGEVVLAYDENVEVFSGMPLSQTPLCTFTCSENAHAIVSDINGDGREDLVFSDGDEGKAYAHYQALDVTLDGFVSKTIDFAALAGGEISLASEDFNDDGYDDLLATGIGDTVYVHLQSDLAPSQSTQFPAGARFENSVTYSLDLGIYMSDDHPGATYGIPYQEDQGKIRATLQPDGTTVTFEAVDNFTGRMGFRFEITDANDKIYQSQTFYIESVAPASAPDNGPSISPGTVALAAGAGLGIAAVALGGAVAVSQNLKWGLMSLLLIPLYTKLKKEEVLDHFVRGEIFGYIRANPGEHYNGIKRALGLTNGSLAYHLQTLERENFVKSSKDGFYRRYYPAGMQIPEEVERGLNHIQSVILEIIRANPGITQKEIATAVNLSPATINYHISILADALVIRVQRDGMRTRCYIEN